MDYRGTVHVEFKAVEEAEKEAHYIFKGNVKISKKMNSLELRSCGFYKGTQE